MAIEPMRYLVQDLMAACKEWLEVDELPSPPATRELLQRTDASLSKAMRVLRDAYPRMIRLDE